MNKITKIENFSVNLSLLVEEYKTFIESRLEDKMNRHVNIVVQKRFYLIHNNRENSLLENMPYSRNIISEIKKIFNFKDVVYRSLQPCTNYRWHKDNEYECIHIPLITNDGCLFVYEDENYRMLPGFLYKVKNNIGHTFINSGDKPRIHLMFQNI